MCVIAYKPTNYNFPMDSILKNCYDNNPDGAGFMYAWNGKVYIQKGYETWESFKGALDRARAKTGDKIPYVMHFRIATQGFERTMTHPFPLSSKMSKLKKLRTDCNIGVAHNGVLELTSDGAKDYSDTMKFITDYLALIIRNFSWFKDERTKTLIERLIDGSRLAILDKNGHCELMGRGWVEDQGIWYSNSSYSYKKVVYRSPIFDDDWDDYEYSPRWNGFNWSALSDKGMNNGSYLDAYNEDNDSYDFTEDECPVTLEDDDSYCSACNNKCNCIYYNRAMNMD